MTPRTIGNYQILGELGRGGMGVVYHGRDPGIGRPVAIKVIRIEPGATADEGAELRKRLIREASAAGQMSHSGIVTVYQLGEEGGDIFVVMEYVQGETLRHVLASGPRPDGPRVLEILRQIAEALDYAHRAGVVHRDIKPANILVREDGCIKVADFGIAKMMQDQSAGLTAVGASLGSPSYMSPEQVRAEQIDGRSDQFSLAIVAWQLLTGRLPFGGDTPHAIMYKIVAEDPIVVQPEFGNLSPRITAALKRALSKNASDRFPTCAAFVRELADSSVTPVSAGSDAETVRVATPAPREPATQPVGTAGKRSLLIPAVVALVVLLAAGGYWVFRNKRSGVVGGDPGTAASTKADSPLVKAIAEGRVDDAKSLIEKGTDVNSANADGTTALMQAAEGSPFLPNNVSAVSMLLEKNAKVDAQDTRGRTALHRAIGEGKEDAVRVLLAQKANPNVKDNDGSTSVLAAVVYGRMGMLKMLLDSGGDIELVDGRGATPLMLASEGNGYMPNNAPLVQALLDKGAKLETQDSVGRTALDRAAAEGKVDAVRLLLDKKANVNHRAANGASTLLGAVTYGRQPVAELLLQRGAEVDQADAQGDTPLMVAAEGAALPNNGPMVAVLLAAKAKVELQDERGRSALYRAAAGGKEDAVRLLLDKQANPNLRATDGSTPLLEAATYGKLGVATLLVERKADVNLADAGGNTPLMVAAEGAANVAATADMLALLLAHGAKTNLTDGQGRTALARATESKNVAGIEILKKK